MPYRRLPNTDTARLNALKTAVGMSMKVSHFNLAFSHQTLLRAKSFLPVFDQSINRYKEALKNQTAVGRKYRAQQKKAKLYISHFMQVMNMMIARKELKENYRRYFSLDVTNRNVPDLSTDTDILTWGQRIIEGEQNRQKEGAPMITNPSAAVVRVHFENFKQQYHIHKDLKKIQAQVLAKVAEKRKDADDIILNIWNETEKYFCEFPDEEKRKQAAEYGVVYFFRPSEKKIKKELKKIKTDPVSSIFIPNTEVALQLIKSGESLEDQLFLSPVEQVAKN